MSLRSGGEDSNTFWTTRAFWKARAFLLLANRSLSEGSSAMVYLAYNGKMNLVMGGGEGSNTLWTAQHKRRRGFGFRMRTSMAQIVR